MYRLFANKIFNSASSMKLSLEQGEGSDGNGMIKLGLSEKVGERETHQHQVGFKKQEEKDVVYHCCKTDGKGWQCGREVKQGHTMCEHHLAQLQNYAVLAGKKSAETTRRRPRAKKASSEANPNEFYYYSGFGPLWGKKRGPGRARANMSTPTKTTSSGVHDLGTTTINSKGVQFEDSKRVEVAKTRPSSSESISDQEEELDYSIEYEDDDDDDDDDDEDIVGSGKKRARKPIKARSLKSLM